MPNFYLSNILFVTYFRSIDWILCSVHNFSSKFKSHYDDNDTMLILDGNKVNRNENEKKNQLEVIEPTKIDKIL